MNDLTLGNNAQEYKLYRRRWIVLLLFALFCLANGSQWTQYTIIADVIKEYYNVGDQAVSWTSLIWMLVYVIFIFPATWLYNKIGLRYSILLGQSMNLIASWIKVASVSPDLFWVTMLGQTVVSLAQVYSISTPAAVAAVWFGSKEVSTACALGVFGLQFGNIIGFLLPPLIVHKGTSEEMGQDLFIMFLAVAIFNTILQILIVIFLQDAPPTPPSSAQAQRNEHKQEESVREFVSTISEQIKNRDFVLLFLTYGINIAVFSAFVTFINPMVLEKFPNGQQDAGNIGSTFMAVGVTATVVVGYLLDRTRMYKATCLALFLLSTMSLIAYTLLLEYSTMPYIYTFAALVGFFLIGHIPAGYEFATELTYPALESTTNSILAFGAQVFAFFVTYAYGIVIENYHAFASNWLVVTIQALGIVLSVFINNNLRRQRAENEAKP